jgi:hypothetical protein
VSLSRFVDSVLEADRAAEGASAAGEGVAARTQDAAAIPPVSIPVSIKNRRRRVPAGDRPASVPFSVTDDPALG